MGTSSGGSISNNLRQVTVPVISNDDCDTYPYYRNQIYPTMMCAGLLTKEAKTPAKETLTVHSSATDPSVESSHGESDVLKPNTQESTPVFQTTSTGSTAKPNKLFFDY